MTWKPWPCPADGQPYEVRVPGDVLRYFVVAVSDPAPWRDNAFVVRSVAFYKGGEHPRLMLTTESAKWFESVGAQWRALPPVEEP